MESNFHIPVMLREAVDSLACKPSGVYIDGTLGGGGHALEILKRTAPGGKLIGLDVDDEALAEAERKLGSFGGRKVLIRRNFAELADVVEELGIGKIDGILLDLGVSSHQLETAGRGFSFILDAPLDMRLGRGIGPSAYDLVNELSERDMARIIREYGEERRAGRIARAIVSRRRNSPDPDNG